MDYDTVEFYKSPITFMNYLAPNITAVEKIYREKSTHRHKPLVPPTPAAKPEEKTKSLNHDDVEAILENRRAATIEELEWLLQHANDVAVLLSNTEELELRNLAARNLLTVTSRTSLIQATSS